MDHRNPAMGQLKDGSVLVVYEIDRSYGSSGERLKEATTDGIYTMRSNDRGRTWKGPMKSPLPTEYCVSPFGKIVQLSDGTALVNVYYGKRPTMFPWSTAPTTTARRGATLP